MFNNLKYLLILLIIVPFPSQSNSLFQKTDIELKNDIILNDEKHIEKKLGIPHYQSKYFVKKHDIDLKTLLKENNKKYKTTDHNILSASIINRKLTLTSCCLSSLIKNM